MKQRVSDNARFSISKDGFDSRRRYQESINTDISRVLQGFGGSEEQPQPGKDVAFLCVFSPQSGQKADRGFEPLYRFMNFPDTPPEVCTYLRRDEYPNEVVK